MQKGATPHTIKKTIQALRYVFGEINGEDRIISKGLCLLRSPDLNPCNFYLSGKLKSVEYANNPYDLKALKQNIREAIYNIQQRELQHVSRNLMKKFRYVSQQRADILNIFYDGEYNTDCYILLIINARSKKCVLTVPAALKHSCRQVTRRFRRKLPTAKSASNQPAL
jgi:hypothetical protein